MRTIDIPGGKANLREPSELKERHKRMIEIAAMPVAGILGRLPDSQLREAIEASAEDQEESGRQLDALLQALPDLTRQDANAIFELQDATIIAMLESWTLAVPLPDLNTIQDLDVPVYQALADATKSDGALITRGGARVDFSPHPDKSRPTGLSRRSGGGLRAAKGRSTPRRPRGGGSTGTARSTVA